MIVQVLGDVPPELHVTPEQDERLAEQARRVGGAEVVRLLDLIAVAFRAMKDGADARTQLELALVKAATPELEPSVKALLARIDRLENRGYLVRELDPADRRSFRLPLTKAGQAVAAQVLAAIADLERNALSRLDATQLAGYHAVITALQEAC